MKEPAGPLQSQSELISSLSRGRLRKAGLCKWRILFSHRSLIQTRGEWGEGKSVSRQTSLVKISIFLLEGNWGGGGGISPRPGRIWSITVYGADKAAVKKMGKWHLHCCCSSHWHKWPSKLVHSGHNYSAVMQTEQATWWVIGQWARAEASWVKLQFPLITTCKLIAHVGPASKSFVCFQLWDLGTKKEQSFWDSASTFTHGTPEQRINYCWRQRKPSSWCANWVINSMQICNTIRPIAIKQEEQQQKKKCILHCLHLLELIVFSVNHRLLRPAEKRNKHNRQSFFLPLLRTVRSSKKWEERVEGARQERTAFLFHVSISFSFSPFLRLATSRKLIFLCWPERKRRRVRDRQF